MAKAETKNYSTKYNIRSKAENAYGLRRLNFSVNHALKPKNRMPDYICSRVEEDVWKVTHSSDNKDEKLIQVSPEYRSAEDIASKIDEVYQSFFD